MLKIINSILERTIRPLVQGKIAISGQQSRKASSSVEELVASHFEAYSDVDHPCLSTLSMALRLLNGSPANILETGSSAWGTNSSLLFDGYVNSFGGSFETVDIRLQPCMTLKKLCTSHTKLNCDDSVAFLKRKASGKDKYDLVYLDSWDVNWANPVPSAMHGLNEFLAISSCLKEGSLLLVDDTPENPSIMDRVQPSAIKEFLDFKKRHGFYPGKGSLIKELLLSIGRGKQLAHEYQLLWQF